MPTRQRRTVTLLDLLILIAATAAGLVLLRISVSGIRARTLSRSSGALIASYLTTIQVYPSCFLPPFGLAIMALSFRGRTESIPKVVRRPGFIGCTVATAGVVAYSVVCSAQIALGKLSFDPAALSRVTSVFTLYAPLMIAGAWLSLALCGRWRAETNWVGWAGRIVSIAWIGLFLFGWARAFV